MSDGKRDLAFMNTPEEWPCWPVLPLKKTGASWGNPKGLGFMVGGLGATVFVGFMFIGPDWSPGLHKDKITYDSFEAIIADGWRVD